MIFVVSETDSETMVKLDWGWGSTAALPDSDLWLSISSCIARNSVRGSASELG